MLDYSTKIKIFILFISDFRNKASKKIIFIKALSFAVRL